MGEWGIELLDFLSSPFIDRIDVDEDFRGLLLPPTDIWSHRYIVEQNVLPDGSTENVYYRLLNTSSVTGTITEVPRSEWTLLHPITDRFEILAFTSVANAEALGNVGSAVGPFSTFVDITDLVKADYARLNERSTHSYQFYHDYYATQDFWNAVKEETDFDTAQ